MLFELQYSLIHMHNSRVEKDQLHFLVFATVLLMNLFPAEYDKDVIKDKKSSL